MKKLFTTDNFMTGMLTIMLVLSLYGLFSTMNEKNWTPILIILAIFPVSATLGYFINKLANKYIK